MLVAYLDGGIRLEIIFGSDGIDLVVERADIFLAFQSFGSYLSFGDLNPRVAYVEEQNTLRFNNAQTDLALLLKTLDCIAKSDQAYATMGQELVGQITNAYTDDENNIHIERLGQEAVYVKLDGTYLTVFMFNHFEPFIQVEHGPLPREVYEPQYVFVYGDEHFPGVEFDVGYYTISFDFPFDEAQVRRMVQTAGRMLAEI